MARRLTYTGERFIPGSGDAAIELEHLHRYAIAAAVVGGRTLDLGCGAGYGARLLIRRARQVIAVDAAPEAVWYAAGEGREARHLGGDARRLPFASHTFDWVVCFELIEHVLEIEAVLDEVARVLAPAGALLLSTPNRPVYAAGRGHTNPFHLRELDAPELRSLLVARFADVQLFGQQLIAASASLPLGDAGGDGTGAGKAAASHLQATPSPPEGPAYLLALCGHTRIPAAASRRCRSLLPARLETFLAEREASCRAGEEVTRRAYEAEIHGLTQRLGEFDARIRELGAEVAARQAARERDVAALRAESATNEACLERERSAIAAELQQHAVAAERRAADAEQRAAAAERLAADQESAQRETLEALSRLAARLAATEERAAAAAREREEAVAVMRLESQALRTALATEGGRRARERARLQRRGVALRAMLDRECRERAGAKAVACDARRQAQDLVADGARLRRDLDWAYRQGQAREAELAALHGSKMWGWWMVYHRLRRLAIASRRTLASPFVRLASALRRGGAHTARAVTAAGPGLLHSLGWPYLAAATAATWAAALARAAWQRPHGLAPAPPAAARAGGDRPPRILLVAPYRLYPADHGGGTRILNLVRRLRGCCELHLLIFARGDEAAVQRPILEPLVKSLCFHAWEPALRPDRWGMLPKGAQLFSSPEVSQHINEILAREAIDILQLEYTELGQYGLPRFERVKVVLTEPDITFRSRARRWRAGLHRRYDHDRAFGRGLVDWMRLLRFELQVVRRADQVHVMSEVDRRYLARFLPPGARGKLRVVANGVAVDDIAPGEPHGRDRRQLLFVGNFGHLPNLDAVDFLVSAVWPAVRSRHPEAELVVVGSGGHEMLGHHRGAAGVRVLGMVVDTIPYYQRCRALVAPIRAGSGTRLKVLEALACGTPVVSTTLGVEGIEGANGEHFLLADDAPTLADAICRVLADDALCARLGAAGRGLVESRYGWERSAACALEGYRSLLPADSPPSPEPADAASVDDGTVSVIVPTCDGGVTLDRCLAAVARQRTSRRVEIVCVDSGSGAGDLDVMQRHRARVVPIPRREFDHGLARDLGAANSRGSVLVFLNQDAVPVDEDWLEGMIEPLVRDGRCAAVQGGIVELPERDRRFYWDSCGERFYFTRESRRWLERYCGIGFSTVNAALRREVWNRHPFGRAPIMEDKKWQRAVVAAGYGITCAPRAAVYHSHDYTLRTLWRRCYSEGLGWRSLGEVYTASDLLADLWQPRMLRDLMRGLARREVRSGAELLYPWLRPLTVFGGNRWGRTVRL